MLEEFRISLLGQTLDVDQMNKLKTNIQILFKRTDNSIDLESKLKKIIRELDPAILSEQINKKSNLEDFKILESKINEFENKFEELKKDLGKPKKKLNITNINVSQQENLNSLISTKKIYPNSHCLSCGKKNFSPFSKVNIKSNYYYNT